LQIGECQLDQLDRGWFVAGRRLGGCRWCRCRRRLRRLWRLRRYRARLLSLAARRQRGTYHDRGAAEEQIAAIDSTARDGASLTGPTWEDLRDFASLVDPARNRGLVIVVVGHSRMMVSAVAPVNPIGRVATAGAHTEIPNRTVGTVSVTDRSDGHVPV
jgi:hypothetical protein